MKRAAIWDAPAALNTNDKAMWVLGFNAALEAACSKPDATCGVREGRPALTWSPAPNRSEWGEGMVVADVGVTRDSTATIFCEAQDAERVAEMFAKRLPTASQIHLAIEAEQPYATHFRFEGDGQFGMHHEARNDDPRARPFFDANGVKSILKRLGIDGATGSAA